MSYVDYKMLGKRIADRRKKMRLTQKEVSERAELSEKYLSRLERAASIMSIDVLLRICDVLDITPNYLLLGIQDEYTKKEFPAVVSDELKLASSEKKEFLKQFIEWYLEYEKKVR